MLPTRLKLMGGVDFKIPNVSYCKDANDVHFNPYNLIEFYVGEITGTTPQTVKIYTDKTTSVDVTVSKGNKWYSYVLPKDKGLSRIESGVYDSDEDKWSNGIVTKTVIKANITANSMPTIIPYSTVEASFKGSNTSNVTNMRSMFEECTRLKSLDLSGWDTSNVTNMFYMFYGCGSLTSLNLSGCNTSNVTNMIGMFYGCASLTSLDLSGWDMSNVTSMDIMFSGCNSLKTITMIGCSPATINKIKAKLETAGIINNVTIVTEYK